MAFTNSSGTPIKLTNNWWGTTIVSNITSIMFNNGSYSDFIPYRLFGPFDINKNSDTETLPVVSLITAQVSGYEINLTWEKTSGGDFHHYNIYHSTTPGTTNLSKADIIARIFNINSTNYTHNVPTNGLNYYYITASDNYPVYTNESWYSSHVSASAPHGGPFYVSTSGSDTNIGTFSKPFKTIQKAVDVMNSGITIPTCYIFPGIYSEQVMIVSNKNSGYMVLTKLSNAAPILNGSPPMNFAVKITNADKIIISGLEICKYSNGIIIEGHSISNIIQENTIYSNFWEGIFINSDLADNNIIRRNSISGPNQTCGILINEGDNNTILFNTINYNTFGIIVYGNSSYNNILKNTVYSNTARGIALDSGSSYNLIGTNNIYGWNQDYGISLSDTEDNTIISNKIYCNQAYGIYCWNFARDNDIVNNIIYSNNNSGIYLNSGMADFYLIKKNIIYGWNQDYGIRVLEGERNTIESNIIYQNSDSGIFLSGWSRDNIINKNTVYSNNSCGIWIDSEQADNNIISANSIYGLNQDNGIYILNGDNNTVNANMINYNEINGIFINGSGSSIIKYNNINNNIQGIYYTNSLSPVYQNNIASNTIGFLYKGSGLDEFSRNNIFNNAVNLSNTLPAAIKLTNNWWGTTIADQIQIKIKGQAGYSNFTPYRLFNKFNILENADNNRLPTVSSATCFLTSGQDVNLIWKKADNTLGDFVRYFIYRTNIPGYTDLSGNNVKIIIDDINTTNYIDNPETGTWYYYITALDNPQPPVGSIYTNESWYCAVKGSITIKPHTITITTNINYPNRIITGSTNNLPVLSFKITDEREHDFQTIKISNSGDMTNGRDIEYLKLWFDLNNDYNWDAGDVFITNAVWNISENKWIFSSLSVESGTNLLATIDIPSTAANGKNFRAKVLTSDTICEGGGTNINMVSNTGTITLNIPHKIEIIKTDIQSYQTSILKTNQPVLAFKYSDSYLDDLNKLKITLLGNIAVQTDIWNMKIFTDNGTIGQYDLSDIYVTNLYFSSNLNKWTNDALNINNFSGLLITIDTLPSFQQARSFRAGITSINDIQGSCSITASYTITNTGFITSDISSPSFAGVKSAKLINENTVQLQWDPAIDNCSVSSNIIYNIYMALTPGNFNFLNPDRSVTNITSINMPDLTIGQTYYFVIRAVDELNNEDINNNERSISVSGAKDDFSKVKIYPNPGYKNEILKIEDLTGKGIIKIFTISGNLIKKINFNSISGSKEISLNDLNLASGMYVFIFISDGVEIKRYKFVYMDKLRN